MSDTTGPVSDPTPTSATEPLQLADQRPVEPTQVADAPRKNHTRTILEVVGAGVAAVLILAAGGLGFALGHVTGSGERGHDDAHAFSQGAPTPGGPGGGMMDGQRDHRGPQGQWGPQGIDPRGIDPDGDNWTGGGMTGGAPVPPAAPGSPSVQ